MSRSFETEYRNYICADLPDLWDRIEAKLDEQEAAKKTNVTEFAKPEKDVKPARKRAKIRWQYFGAAAAAAVCMLVAIPVIKNMQGAQTTAPQSADYAGSGNTTETVDPQGTTLTEMVPNDHPSEIYGPNGLEPNGLSAFLSDTDKNHEALKAEPSVAFRVTVPNSLSVWITGSDSSGSKGGNASTASSITVKDTYTCLWDSERAVQAQDTSGFYAQQGLTGMSMAQAQTDTISYKSVTFVVAVQDGTGKDEMDQVLKALLLYKDPAISFELTAATGTEKNYGQYTLTMSGDMTPAQLSDLKQSVCEIIGKHDFVTMIFMKSTTAVPATNTTNRNSTTSSLIIVK